MSTKITLRRAAKLRNRMMERLREISSTDLRRTAVNVNVYDPDVIAQVDNETQAWNTAFARFTALSAALSEVRDLIGKVNASNGVDSLLTSQVALLGQRAVLAEIASNVNVRPTNEQIKARIEGSINMAKTGAAPRRGYGVSEDSHTISTITQEMRDAATNELQLVNRQLDIIQDRLESINSHSHIELNDEVLATIANDKLA